MRAYRRERLEHSLARLGHDDVVDDHPGSDRYLGGCGDRCPATTGRSRLVRTAVGAGRGGLLSVAAARRRSRRDGTEARGDNKLLAGEVKLVVIHGMSFVLRAHSVRPLDWKNQNAEVNHT